MKDSVILLASILGCLSLKAQNTLYKSENAPRPGDKIIKERISYFDPGEKGEKSGISIISRQKKSDMN